MLYKNSRFKRNIFSKYTTNLKTTISQRSLRNLGLLLFLFEFNNFSFIKHIIDKTIYTSISRDKNSHQWQCSILVTVNERSHVIIKLHCHIDFRINLFYINFSRQQHQIELSWVSINS